MTSLSYSVAISGASGAAYGLRLLEQLLGQQHRVYLMVSSPAQIVFNTELGLKLPSQPREMGKALLEHLGLPEADLRVLGKEQWMSPVASGSNAPQAMVVCPCSMATVSSIAHGSASNLMERAADVMIKERRQLILVPRETPFSAIHLENMLKLARLGVTILPANPGFYHQPQRVEDLVDFVVQRILDHLGVSADLSPRWGD